MLTDYFTTFFSGYLSYFRISTCTKTTCTLFAKLDFKWSIHPVEGLFVGISTDKLYTFDIGLHHMLYSITATTAYTKYSETGLTVAIAWFIFY